MIYKIKNGNHWPGFFGWLVSKWIRFVDKPFSISRRVVFYPDCKYTIPIEEDRGDINKLFGMSFGLVHKNSARFGWSYDKGSNRFLLYAYCYFNGRREYQLLGDISLAQQPLLMTIVARSDSYEFIIKKDFDIIAQFFYRRPPSTKWCFGLGLWFGGNNPSPNDMTIKIAKAL